MRQRYDATAREGVGWLIVGTAVALLLYACWTFWR